MAMSCKLNLCTYEYTLLKITLFLGMSFLVCQNKRLSARWVLFLMCVFFATFPICLCIFLCVLCMCHTSLHVRTVICCRLPMSGAGGRSGSVFVGAGEIARGVQVQCVDLEGTVWEPILLGQPYLWNKHVDIMEIHTVRGPRCACL